MGVEVHDLVSESRELAIGLFDFMGFLCLFPKKISGFMGYWRLGWLLCLWVCFSGLFMVWFLGFIFCFSGFDGD